MTRRRGRGDVAVVGMAGRFPGAPDLDVFWRNLREGVESVVPVTAADLAGCGMDPTLIDQSGYVAAAAPIDEIDMFDAPFFGYSPREAEGIDPQQRLFLEAAWHALEDAGMDPVQSGSNVGVFAGCTMSTYVHQLYANAKYMAGAGALQTLISNDKDYLSTRVSYKLNLQGPSIGVQTACSTGLVVVVMAANALLSGECDTALAGAVTVRVPHRAGYWFQPGGIYAPDGHCRPFSGDAQGTVFGSGLGIVVLKRLADAISDRYNVRAVIRGATINNDGGFKVGFTAPSLRGQTEVIKAAHSTARIDPSTIDYVETHGTGTRLGDPIEVEALSNAFAGLRNRTEPCALGSVKSNIGHLDAAAGIAGFVKAVLMLEHGEIPASLHAEPPNADIPFDQTPFRVNTALRHWPAQKHPRRAGVSAFGIGGTNAHVVLEEAPPANPDPTRREFQLLALSAATPTALQSLRERVADHLSAHPGVDLADLAYTTQIGRRALRFRRSVTCADADEAIRALRDSPGISGPAQPASEHCTIAFMFSGQGTQHHAMATALYRSEPGFAEALDYCAESLRPRLGLDLRELIAQESSSSRSEEIDARLRHTSLAQPALFAVEYSVACMLSGWGIEPSVMIGHSVGEWVAACLAGVFSLDDALRLIAERGRLVGALPEGAMLAVPLAEGDVAPLLRPGSAVASVNEAGATIVGGPAEEIDALRAYLATRGMSSQTLHTSHAFHSPAMEPAVAPLVKAVSAVRRRSPRVPYVSNVTGTWVRPEEATDPEYWGRHLRSTVRFADGMSAILESASAILEVGPGATLSRLALRHPQRSGQLVAPTLPGPQEKASCRSLLEAIGQLWSAGGSPDWLRFHASYGRRRVKAPGYPFERRRYWVDGPAAPGKHTLSGTSETSTPSGRRDLSEWFAAPAWRSAALTGAGRDSRTRTWLVLDDDTPLGTNLVARLRRTGDRVVTVAAGSGFERVDLDRFEVDPARATHMRDVVQAMLADGAPPDSIAHLWCVTESEDSEPTVARFDAGQDRGFHSLLALAKALTASLPQIERIDVVVAATGLHLVTGQEMLSPAKATLLGPIRSMSQEYPQLAVRCMDIDITDSAGTDRIAEYIAGEVDAEDGETLIAFRKGERLALHFDPVRLPTVAADRTLLRRNGVYLITGGLGNVGYNLAETLAREVKGRLVLLARADLPPRSSYERVLASTDPKYAVVADRIRRVRRLEALGATVMVRSASLTDAQALRCVIDEAESRFGRLNGIIHAAGNVDPAGFPTIDQTGPEVELEHFAPKVHGLLTLVEVMADRPPMDFWLMVSSLSTVLGGLGFSAYAGANSFIDCYAATRSGRSPSRWISVNWDAWDFTEPAIVTAIRPAEGQETFMRVMGNPDLSRVVVSVAPLQSRLDRWANLRSLCGTSGRRIAPEAESHRRPDAAGDYLAPTCALERELAAMWQEILGIERVGINDNFFSQLGGHSLLATQLISQIRARYGVDLPLPAFFERPTVQKLSETVTLLRSEVNGDRPPQPAPIRRGRLTRAVLQGDELQARP